MTKKDLVSCDLTDAVLAIARAVSGGGRIISSYSTPAWAAKLTRADGKTMERKGPTATQALLALGEALRRA